MGSPVSQLIAIIANLVIADLQYRALTLALATLSFWKRFVDNVDYKIYIFYCNI